MGFNPFSRSDWKRAARKASWDTKHHHWGWEIAGWLLIAAIVITILKGCQ